MLLKSFSGIVGILRWMSIAARDGQRRGRAFWKTAVDPGSVVRGLMMHQLEELVKNEWTDWYPPPVRVVRAVSDASDVGWAWVCGDVVEHGVPPSCLRNAPIHLKELFGVVRLVQWLTSRVREAKLVALCDNKAVIGYVRRGYSLDGVTMAWLQLLDGWLRDAGCTLELHYVPSKDNEADRFTRLAYQRRTALVVK